MNKEKIIKLFYISIFTIVFSLLFFYPTMRHSKIQNLINNQILKSQVYEYATQCFPNQRLLLITKETLTFYTDCRGEFSEIEINGKKFNIEKNKEGWKSWVESRQAIKSFNLTNKDFKWEVKEKLPNYQVIEHISNVVVIILFILSLIGIWFTRKYSICFVDYFNKFIKIIFKKI